MIKVFVYRNLRKKCWSIRDVKSGLVIAHRDNVTLQNAHFKVSEAGRQRVLRQKRKNVHAGVMGELVDLLPWPTLVQVSYNPYKGPTFVIGQTTVNNAAYVRLDELGKVWV